ncbi:hypothetical protein [Streptomyces antnestii]|nr:hypothetical protein [Streptomyces sp. San01]
MSVQPLNRRVIFVTLEDGAGLVDLALEARTPATSTFCPGCMRCR